MPLQVPLLDARRPRRVRVMSERMCWSTDPFLRDVHITDDDRATVLARLAREDDADELADELGMA